MPEQIQTPWGTWDEQSAKDELAKMEGDFLSVPSPGDLLGRMAPRHPNMKMPFAKWLLHFAVYVDGYDAIHVCMKHFDDKAYCPICAATRRLYDASQAEKDIFYNAGSDIRQKSNYYWNVFPNVYEAKYRDSNGNDAYATAILPNASIKCLPYGAGESVQRRLLQFRPDCGDFTHPITGRNIKLSRHAVGDQAARFAPTQADISNRVTPVTQDIYDFLSKPGVRDLALLYQPTTRELMEEVCQQYVAKIFDKAGVRMTTGIQSPGIPTPPPAPAAQTQAPLVPLIPAGVSPPPAPTAPQGQPPAAAAFVPAQIAAQPSAMTPPPMTPPPAPQAARPAMPDLTPPSPQPAAAAAAAAAPALAPVPAGAIPVQNIDGMVAGIGG